MAAPFFDGFSHTASGTSTSTGSAEIVALAPTTTGRKFLVFASGQFRGKSSGKRAQLEFHIDGVNTYNGLQEDNTTPDDATAFSFVDVRTINTDIAFHGDNEAGGSGFDYWNLRLGLIDVNDWVEGTDYHRAEQLTDTALPAVRAEMMNLSFTPNFAGEVWLIFAFSQITDGAAADDAYTVWLNDGTNDVAVRKLHFNSDASNQHAQVLYYTFTAPDTSAVTFAVDHDDGGVGGGTNTETFILAVRAQALSANFDADTQADYTVLANITEEDMGFDSALTLSGTADVLLIGNVDFLNPGSNVGGTIYPKVGAAYIPSTFSTLAVAAFNDTLQATDDPNWFGFTFDVDRAAGAVTYDWHAYSSLTPTLTGPQTIALEVAGGGAPNGGGGAATLQGDVSPEYIAALASAAGVTLTRGSIVGQLNEIAGRVWPDYLEFEAAKEAAETAAGL